MKKKIKKLSNIMFLLDFIIFLALIFVIYTNSKYYFFMRYLFGFVCFISLIISIINHFTEQDSKKH